MKPMPASRMHSPICSGDSSIFTPKAESTSAAPERDDSARLPCLATGTPAPATMSAAQVEMLNEPDASPPVPTTSIALSGAATRSILPRMAVTAPVISSTVSPRTRNPISSAPICDGVASPDIICSKAVAASSRVSAAPVATLPNSPLKFPVTVTPSIDPRPRLRARELPQVWLHARRTALAPPGRRIPGCRDVEKILQHQVAMLGGDAFRVKLHAVHGQARVREPHDDAAVGVGSHGELARQACALDHERMVARRLERRIDAAKDAAAVVADLRQFAVHLRRRSHHLAAEGLADRLMAEADAEDRNFLRRLRDQIEADAGLLGRARPGRQHDGVRVGSDHGFARHFVVATDLDFGAQLTEIVHQVEGEAVIIVDQPDHRESP